MSTGSRAAADGRSTIGVSQQASYSKTPPTASRSITGTTLTLSYQCAAQPICGVAYDVQVPRGVAVRASTRRARLRFPHWPALCARRPAPG